jgi:hypothetical protein
LVSLQAKTRLRQPPSSGFSIHRDQREQQPANSSADGCQLPGDYSPFISEDFLACQGCTTLALHIFCFAAAHCPESPERGSVAACLGDEAGTTGKPLWCATLATARAVGHCPTLGPKVGFAGPPYKREIKLPVTSRSRPAESRKSLRRSRRSSRRASNVQRDTLP